MDKISSILDECTTFAEYDSKLAKIKQRQLQLKKDERMSQGIKVSF